MEIPKSINTLLSNTSEHVYTASVAYCDATVDSWCISDKVVEYVQLIGIVFISGFLGLFGIVTNLINLTVFSRLGFRETINISLSALSISDLGASMFLVWVTICFNPLLEEADVNLYFSDIYFYTGMWPRIMCMMLSAFFTVFISIERCLCLFFPLKVKSIMTAKRVTSVVIAIYVIIVASLVYNYTIFRIRWEWVPNKNRSMFRAYYFPHYRPVEMLSIRIKVFYIFTSYTIVLMCTVLFGWKLNRRRQWRQSVSSGTDAKSSVRDAQIVKMLTCVAVIFIVCLSPDVILTFLMLSSPELDIDMKYHNMYITLDCLLAMMGAINSSVNIFVYYKMMSKYKAVFKALFLKNIQT